VNSEQNVGVLRDTVSHNAAPLMAACKTTKNASQADSCEAMMMAAGQKDGSN